MPGAWEPQACHGYDVSLHLVDSTAERQRRCFPIGPFEQTAEERTSLAGFDDANGTDDFEQRAVTLDEKLRAP